MADGSSHRTVTVERVTQGVVTVTNTRGGLRPTGHAAVPVLYCVAAASSACVRSSSFMPAARHVLLQVPQG